MYPFSLFLGNSSGTQGAHGCSIEGTRYHLSGYNAMLSVDICDVLGGIFCQHCFV